MAGLRIAGFTIGNIAEVEAQRALRVTPRGADYGALGAYGKGLQSGTMAAGISANSPVFSLRYAGAQLCLIRRVRLSASALGTAFAAGAARFDMFAARSFTANDTGGTGAALSGNNGKLRTNMTGSTGVGDIRISSTAALTPVTRTLDTDPLASLIAGVVATAGIGIVLPDTWLFGKGGDEQPLALAQNEGFVIQATVPATGTWGFAVTVDYDEVPLASW